MAADAFGSFGYILRSGAAGLYGNSIFNRLGHCYVICTLQSFVLEFEEVVSILKCSKH